MEVCRICNGNSPYLEILGITIRADVKIAATVIDKVHHVISTWLQERELIGTVRGSESYLIGRGRVRD
jgi:hypothetical protein